jgi:hypothetical protein
MESKSQLLSNGGINLVLSIVYKRQIELLNELCSSRLIYHSGPDNSRLCPILCPPTKPLPTATQWLTLLQSVADAAPVTLSSNL